MKPNKLCRGCSLLRNGGVDDEYPDFIDRNKVGFICGDYLDRKVCRNIGRKVARNIHAFICTLGEAMV
jgi:hypothetical protein